MVPHRGAVVRHSSEILLVVILGPKFIRSPPLGVMMVPVIIISVSPVVSVTTVLIIRPLPGQAVGPVAPRTVGIHVSPVPIMVVLIPVLLILMMPVTTPRRIVVTTTIAELSFPLPVPSVCITKVSLVGVTIVVSWMSMHLRAVGGGQMRLLGVKAMWDMGLRHQGIPAGARGLWAKWLLNTNHVIFLLLLLLFLSSFLMSHFV